MIDFLSGNLDPSLDLLLDVSWVRAITKMNEIARDFLRHGVFRDVWGEFSADDGRVQRQGAGKARSNVLVAARRDG